MTFSKPMIEVVNLGRISYGNALQAQQKFIRRHVDALTRLPTDEAPLNALLLCEHPPVYTIGIRTAPYPIREEERLKELGAEFYRANRGGLITFHGPGQLVCYPILNLAHFKKSVRWYVGELERTAVQLCSKFGIKAETSSETGVWVGKNKICAIDSLHRPESSSDSLGKTSAAVEVQCGNGLQISELAVAQSVS
ncbi:octanoyl-[acyl-carrier-protein]:protein N-octanoyltransferase LIPT2, mitochondrial isoform X3 [Hemitrygon akajei]|uniref:octanoyl-[acyl-carrier-protein]:protein N-octanoyltransferase LIPT2, mitochondrial isoform X3 n=1 Tax=Hemitrygon akajei TaxID=2704970 RepID=UPI003BF9C0AA